MGNHSQEKTDQKNQKNHQKGNKKSSAETLWNHHGSNWNDMVFHRKGNHIYYVLCSFRNVSEPDKGKNYCV